MNIMGKPSKLSLPLQSSKSRMSTADQDVPRPRRGEPLSKAERLLGTTGLPPTPPLRSQVSRQALASRKNSLVPVSYSGELSDADVMLSPTRIEEVVIPPRFASLRHKPSSDALGARPDVNADHFGTITSVYTQQIKGSRSSLTMRSYYDPTKLPLEVSQQTSASAIRDQALRKGSAPVVGIGKLQRRQPEPERRASTAPSQEGKKRPARLDIGKLFTRPSFSSPKLFAPARTADGTSTSHTSQYFPHATQAGRKQSNASLASTLRSSSNTERNKRIPKPLIAQAQGYRSPSAADDDNDNVKTNVRRPPRGAQNWFDGLLEEEDERDLELEHEMSTPNTELFSPQAAGHAYTYAESSRSPRSSEPPMDLPPTHSSFTEPTSQDSEYSGLGIHAITTPDHRESSPSVHTKGSKFADSDLGDTSILSLSSSDEDTADESIDSRAQDMRNSIRVSEIDSIRLGRAQEVRTRRPSAQELTQGHPRSDNSSRRVTSMSGDSLSIHSSTKGSTHLTVPLQHTRSRRSGHTRQPSSILENSDDDRPGSASSNASIQTSTSRSGRLTPAEAHKLMAVTEEEEALLEMMRRKRAAMAKQSFAEGYKTALRQDVKAPKTPKTPVKKAQYKLHPNIDPRPPRIYRPTRPVSTSSSILDSFPVSRSQRSSLIRSSGSSHTNIFMISTETRDVSRGRPQQARHTSSSSTASAASPFDSTSSSRQAFSPLTLAPLDVMLSPISSPTFEPSHGATSPSPEPLPSPTTPETRRSSAEIMVRLDGSQRDSQTSSSFGAVEDLNDNAKLKTKNASSRSRSNHSRRRTASSDANFLSSDDSDAGNGDTIDPALQRKGNRTSIASIVELRRASVVKPTAHGPGRRHSLNRQSVISSAGSSIDARCSVSEDVLAAWGSLGGWREPMV